MEDMTKNVIDDQNSDIIIDEPQYILEEHVGIDGKDDDDNILAFLNSSANKALLTYLLIRHS